MANITINEISQNYSYNIGSSSFCTVALPITASWGPALLDADSIGSDLTDVLESVTWQKFPASQEGVEAFISTYRGPAANYRIAKDYSYQMALTLLANGYDVLVCRLCPGTKAEVTVPSTHREIPMTQEELDNRTPEQIAQGVTTNQEKDTDNSITLRAKYAGTFGNNLMVKLQRVTNRTYWNAIIYVVDTTGVKTAVENLVFTFEMEKASDAVLHISEIESKFIEFIPSKGWTDNTMFDSKLSEGVQLGQVVTGVTNMIANIGSDRAAVSDVASMLNDAVSYAADRFGATKNADDKYDVDYVQAIKNKSASDTDESSAAILKYTEWLYTNAVKVYDLLKDKISYSPSRIISPGWDDQNMEEIEEREYTQNLTTVSPIHAKLLDVAYHSRCAVSYIDIPKCLQRSFVHNNDTTAPGYAQRLSRYSAPDNTDGQLYNSHAALFAPWGQYMYTGTSKLSPASPSFLALLIERAMIKNQSLQYEWIMPSSRKHNLAIGKLAYTIPKTVLDTWQSTEGTRINILTEMPDMGTILWGNSTLFEVPPATYQALANLSTRKLVNAVKDVVYKVGLGITFNYNNDEAYSKFYVGVSPILDSMKNAGAIVQYKIKMSADINGVDSVNANSVIGKIYMTVNGVIEDINVDLIALPSSVDLSTY